LTGQVAPDFTAKVLDRPKSFNLSDQWGKVVVLDFWATWCGPCMAAMPEIKRAFEQFKDRDDVVFITISLDQEESRLRDVLKAQGLKFPVVFSGQGWQDSTARAFGVNGIPSSFVIGRDGRFAADRLQGSQLVSIVKEVLQKPLDPAFADGRKPARLIVKFTLDQEDFGLPGTVLRLKATDAAKKTVRQEELKVLGAANRLVWLYPPLAAGGAITVTAQAQGMAEQTRSLASPADQAEIVLAFKSPRRISGRVTTDHGKTAAAGMKVVVVRNDGFRRFATSDEQGRFRVSVPPGSYFVSVEGTERLTPIFSRPMLPERTMTEVPPDSDPIPVELAVCRAVVLKGTVRDEQGKPVLGATVRSSGGRKEASTDEQGRFLLSGVPSEGRAVVFAIKGKKFAQKELDGVASDEGVELTLGERMNDPGGQGLMPGRPAPKLLASTLDRTAASNWRPARDKNTLVVFCAFWHPVGRAFLQKARTWADERNDHLAVVSIDWSAAEAKRHLPAPTESSKIFFAGPGGLAVQSDWGFHAPGQAFLVSPQGRILGIPGPLQLP
jgi:thiol-disulfide isomerase/thioredoxin